MTHRTRTRCHTQHHADARRASRSCRTAHARYLTCLVIAIAVASTARTAAAQEEEWGWADTAELTLVVTGGNAEAQTLGFRNELVRSWESANLSLELAALRAESSQITRTATGSSPTSFAVTEDSVSVLTAEHYSARTRYDRNVNERTFWFTGAGWERNSFAGIVNRVSWDGGVGNTWIDNQTSTFRTAYGVSYTYQDDVVPAPDTDDKFAGLRVSYDYRRQVTPTTAFTSVLQANENLQDTSDLRADFVNAVSVTMTGQLALKVSWRLLYDHLPSLVGLPLQRADGSPTGDTVFTRLDTIDHILTFALVASF
ncbi:MAG: DUF481 domain-containing protein [Acidobacteriota bacterium]|nr:DUF481 domain-containing protein [Acidobacteriota bacterium]